MNDICDSHLYWLKNPMPFAIRKSIASCNECERRIIKLVLPRASARVGVVGSRRDLHTYKVEIMSKHIDALGHVNNANYMTLFEDARWAIMEGTPFSRERFLATGMSP